MSKSISVRVGSRSFQSGGLVLPVKFLIPNEMYISTLHDWDFGLIQLIDPLKYTKDIQPIVMPDSDNDVKTGELCTVYSWGELYL